ncbi:hypothetical protein Tco_0203587, partial [Tanacetum coccineum]
ADNLYDVMMETLPSLVKEKVTEQVKKVDSGKHIYQNAIDNAIPSLVDALYPVICQDDPHDDAHPEGENSAKRQKISEYEAYVSAESSSGQDNIEEPGPFTLDNQEQDDEFDFWTDSYASDDDEIPTKQVIRVIVHTYIATLIQILTECP